MLNAVFVDTGRLKGAAICDMERDIPRVIQFIQKYPDSPVDFADAALAPAAEKTGIRNIVSIDSDFDVYRLPGKKRIRNIFCGKGYI
ncbi:MAG: hypothetical protein LBJ35_07345 [Spirochaetaceae bacterium]|nr:hypothetical protein [Spirochaetaceae bacterium]